MQALKQSIYQRFVLNWGPAPKGVSESPWEIYYQKSPWSKLLDDFYIVPFTLFWQSQAKFVEKDKYFVEKDAY